MQRVFGVPCPSCGGTRAAVHLLAGDPLSALSLNAGATVFLVMTGLLVLAGTFGIGELLGVASDRAPMADFQR